MGNILKQKEPPILSQLSDVKFENHQVKMNDSISEKEINGCDLEQLQQIKQQLKF